MLDRIRGKTSTIPSFVFDSAGTSSPSLLFRDTPSQDRSSLSLNSYPETNEQRAAKLFFSLVPSKDVQVLVRRARTSLT